jgi:hypothetical protein
VCAQTGPSKDRPNDIESDTALVAMTRTAPANRTESVASPAFKVRTSFLERYEVQTAGSRDLLEYWIPAEDLDELNANIVGLIELVATYREGVRVEG